MTKKVLFITLFIFVCTVGIVFAQIWYTANEKTVAWDEVTTNKAGEPLPDGVVIKYVIYLANAETDLNKTNPVEIGSTSNLEYTVILNTEGQYFIGVRAQRMSSDEQVLSSSPIGWSDLPEIVAGGEIFGIQYFYPLPSPINLCIEVGEGENEGE